MTARRPVGLLVALGLVAGTAFLSRVPLTLRGPDESSLRLSWRLDPVSVASCRPRTEEELARLPAHMRTPTVCSGGTLPYRLTVAVDGRERIRDTVVASGARADRPMYVFRELGLDPGPRALDVAYVPLPGGGVEPPPGAPVLGWRGTVTAVSGRVVLVTLDTTGRSLEVR